MKTLIAVPSMDQVPARFAQALAMLQKEGDCAVTFQIGSLVYMSRDNLAQQAIQMGADRILWLDSDMVFSPDVLSTLSRTMQETKADMVTGVYFKRVEPFTPVLYEKLELKDGQVSYKDWGELPKEDVFEVAGCGFGCVLMNTDVAMSILAKFHEMFTPLGNMGEDLAFCWRARQLGYKIVCNQTLPLGHVGYNVVTRGFYNVYQKNKGRA